MSSSLPALRQVASMYAEVIVETIQREYPNALRHTMTGPDDCPTPRQIHPSFYGCFDWHSCVEMHWALIRLLRLVPDAIAVSQAKATLDSHLTLTSLEQEAAYLQAHPGFERPYGWGWALMLADEVSDWQDASAQVWAQAVTPLAQQITTLMLAWLPKATYPNREGMHGNTAFGLARSLPWARRLADAGDSRLLEAIRAAALRWYQQDRQYPAGWEPGGSDFLSPSLTEAELMCEVLDHQQFLDWFAAFLPQVAEGRTQSLFEPVTVSDATDGQIAHLHGLNLYRAFAMTHLSRMLAAGDKRGPILLQAAKEHAAASLPAVTGSDYMVEHWLACYAVLYLGMQDIP